MLTVKIAVEDGISLYSSETIHYRVHTNKTLTDFKLEEDSQVFSQIGGQFKYVGLFDVPEGQEVPIDFVEISVQENETWLVGKPANIFVMNENGKTIETIRI